jgi:hypothetical protein
MSWGFFFSLFPMCSPQWVPMRSSSSSQTVPHVFNVFIKVFPIAPHFYPICFTHIPDGSIGRNWALNKLHPRLTHMGGLKILNISLQVVHIILTRNDLKHPNSPISTWETINRWWWYEKVLVWNCEGGKIIQNPEPYSLRSRLLTKPKGIAPPQSELQCIIIVIQWWCKEDETRRFKGGKIQCLHYLVHKYGLDMHDV